MNPTNAAVRRGPSPVSTDFLAAVSSAGSGLPSRVVLHGTEGSGKTSWAAHAPGVVFLQSRGETGLETLIDSGRLSETPHFPEVQDWDEAIGTIQSLRDGEHNFKTIAIDTLNGLERLCAEHVCSKEFSNDWSSYDSYGRGAKVAAPVWRGLLVLLDQVRSQRRMSVVCLAHTKIKTFANPEGPDYDRYEVDMGKEFWGLTLRWADMCLFANYVTAVQKDNGANKAKGKGGRQRVLYTERHAAYDAKNRHGLPEMIQMGSSGAESWANFANALKTARSSNQNTKPATDGGNNEGA